MSDQIRIVYRNKETRARWDLAVGYLKARRNCRTFEDCLLYLLDLLDKERRSREEVIHRVYGPREP